MFYFHAFDPGDVTAEVGEHHDLVLFDWHFDLTFCLAKLASSDIISDADTKTNQPKVINR